MSENVTIVNESEVEEIETTVENVEEAPKTTVENVEEAPKTVIGVILNCTKLNVRKEANDKADVVFVADSSTELVVDEEESTEDWFKVCTDNGIEGFCMKMYMSISKR